MRPENANPVEVSMSEKMWGGEPFWGLGYEWDPDWVLTDRQKELRATLIELCEKEMRANAKRSDDELLFPRRNLELLGEHGFLGLIVPEEYGGLGENHVAFAMALVSHLIPVETRFHETNVDITYSRYRKHGDLSLDESFFPVVWDDTGYRTPWLADLPDLGD